MVANMRSVEVLMTGHESIIGTALLRATDRGARRAGMSVNVTSQYQGKSDWLCMYGVGSPNRNGPRLKHIAHGGLVACWDLGYWKRGKDESSAYLRVSVNHTHPQALLDETPTDSSRFDKHGIKLRSDYGIEGPVIVAGMGYKSKRFLNINNWEVIALCRTQERFPGKRVIYRPKPSGYREQIKWPHIDVVTPIADLLRGASLVVCRHSNVAVDACIAGIPVECEDGAARWLYQHGSGPGEMQRLEFLQRLAWWQWGCWEQDEAWKFLDEIGHA